MSQIACGSLHAPSTAGTTINSRPTLNYLTYYSFPCAYYFLLC